MFRKRLIIPSNNIVLKSEEAGETNKHHVLFPKRERDIVKQKLLLLMSSYQGTSFNRTIRIDKEYHSEYHDYFCHNCLYYQTINGNFNLEKQHQSCAQCKFNNEVCSLRLPVSGRRREALSLMAKANSILQDKEPKIASNLFYFSLQQRRIMIIK